MAQRGTLSSRCLALTAAAFVASAVPGRADDLSNRAFRIEYDASGIRSLKRTNDGYDTDYIAANGRLGPLLVRYRTTRHGDWSELRRLRRDERRTRVAGIVVGVGEPRGQTVAVLPLGVRGLASRSHAARGTTARKPTSASAGPSVPTRPS